MLSSSVNAGVRMEKGFLTEDDTFLLFQRYNASTILVLLQEVSQNAGVKIDWNSLVKKTTTGISNAREYQMLWRHLAYHEKLVKIESGEEPLDDDSDLEYEFKPPANGCGEALVEAATAVKVLMSYGYPNECGPANRSSAEACVATNFPNGHTSRTPIESLQSLNRKPSFSTLGSSEGLDENNPKAANFPARRKRKLWTLEEDLELIAAVQKCGEGNWANILKGDFKHERTASQLSQRWGIIRKRQGNSGQRNDPVNQTGIALSEAQLATRQAVSIALNMPMIGSLGSVGASNSGTTTSESLSQQEAQARKVSPQSPNHRPLQKKMGPSLGYSIQEAAVAAGARIATPSTAASLLKAAQSKNAVHIKKVAPLPSIGPRPSNVHFIRAGSGVVPTISRPGNVAAVGRPTPPAQTRPSGLSVSVNPISRIEDSKITPSTGQCSSASEIEMTNVDSVESSVKIPASSIDGQESLVGSVVDAPSEKVEDRNEGVTCTSGRESGMAEHSESIKNLSDKLDIEVDELVINESARDVRSGEMDENPSIRTEFSQVKVEEQQGRLKTEFCPNAEELLAEDSKLGKCKEDGSDDTVEKNPFPLENSGM